MHLFDETPSFYGGAYIFTHELVKVQSCNYMHLRELVYKVGVSHIERYCGWYSIGLAKYAHLKSIKEFKYGFFESLTLNILIRNFGT